MNGWAIRVIALLAVIGSYWLVYQHGRSVERGEAATASARRDSSDRLAEVLGERGAREEEQRRTAAHEKVKAHAHEQQAVADNDAVWADAAGQRLRDEAGKFATAVGCPGQDPAIAARSEAARRAAMVLSDMLARADARAGELAAAFDRARVAGLACEASYDRLLSSDPSAQ